MIKINKEFIIVESKSNAIIYELKSSNDDRTSFNKNKQYISLKYLGPKLKKYNLEVSKNKLDFSGSSNDYNYDQVITTTFGNGNSKEPSIILLNKDNHYVNRFYFKDAKIIKGNINLVGPHTRNVIETLELIEEDKFNKIELHHYISLVKNSDVFIFKRKLINLNKEPIYIKRIDSVELPINSKDLTINTYDGAWLFERNRHTINIKNGVFINESMLGSSSHFHNPFIEVKDNINNVYYSCNLIYSGNHKELIEVDSIKDSKIHIGINDYLFNYKLDSKKEFITPETLITFNNESFMINSNRYHKFILENIIRKEFIKPRPIVFNSWEGSRFNINEDNLIKMAELAKKVGIECFVIDDGWFKNRVNDSKALGDWTVDKNKFPHGFKSISDRIKKLGLKFGFWVEPEMISIDSDIFRKHPEYAVKTPNMEPVERRHQLMIDMTNPKVRDYLFKTLSKVIEECNPDYIKWDYNRTFTDSFSNFGTSVGEFNHKFILGTYELIERLINKFPNILFESCASGGGRFDLGMFYYMPQCWGSDDSNAYCRSFISNGTFMGYPQSTFGAHVSLDGCPIPNDNNHKSTLDDRFNLQCIGAFGYEFDITKLSQENLDTIKEQITYYKKHRQLIQFGELSVIDDIFINKDYYSIEIVSKDKKEAILFIAETHSNVKPKIFKFKNINKDYKYVVTVRGDNKYKKVLKGLDLINNGLDFKTLNNLDKANCYYNGLHSKLIYIKKVN